MLNWMNSFFYVDNNYTQGINAINNKNYNLAFSYLQQSAINGNADAFWELSLLHSSGCLDKVDIDVSINFLKKAAQKGQKDATYILSILNKITNREFTFNSYKEFMEKERKQYRTIPNGMLLLITSQWLKNFLQQFNVAMDVIKYELNACALSDFDALHEFLKRLPFPSEMFTDEPLKSFADDSPQDVFTDLLNYFSHFLRVKGYSQKLLVYYRVTLLGYIINATICHQLQFVLLGYEDFFSPIVENVDEDDKQALKDLDIHFVVKEHIPVSLWFIVKDENTLIYRNFYQFKFQDNEYDGRVLKYHAVLGDSEYDFFLAIDFPYFQEVFGAQINKEPIFNNIEKYLIDWFNTHKFVVKSLFRLKAFTPSMSMDMFLDQNYNKFIFTYHIYLENNTYTAMALQSSRLVYEIDVGTNSVSVGEQ